MRNKLAWFEAALVITPFVMLAGFWNQIPERVPIHWNIRGEIDGWASKSFGLLITPLIGFLVVALCHVVSWLDPKLRANPDKTDRMKKVLQILALAFAVFFDAVFGVQVAAAFDYKIVAARVITWCILLLFAILGNYLPNLRPNYFVGIRTPWTLERAETWRATHRLGGKLMFFGSLFLLILEFFVSAGVFAFLFVSFILLLVLWSFLYSWHHYRTHEATHEML
jgi:uncharacterized membrane protein